MNYKTKVWELLRESKYVDDDAIMATNPLHHGKAPINPMLFELIDEKMTIAGPARDALSFVRSSTEERGIEYSLMLYGNVVNPGHMRLTNYYFAEGNQLGASFTSNQRAEANRALKEPDGEVVYAHTHVAHGTVYNMFSIDDLAYLVMRAINTKRDVYAMLITREVTIAVKYDLTLKEFFRVAVEEAE